MFINITVAVLIVFIIMLPVNKMILGMIVTMRLTVIMMMILITTMMMIKFTGCQYYHYHVRIFVIYSYIGRYTWSPGV